MRPREYFPLGKASGKAFCNREQATHKLIGNFNNGKHTFMVAPRRYGKSSLCIKALKMCALPWQQIDFHLAITDKDVERLIIHSVRDVIGKSISHIDKLATLIKTAVKKLKPKFDISAGPFKLELEISSESTPAENIVEALLLLERLLQTKNQRAVLLFDEFQEVGNIGQGKGIEGAIRHAAQETKNLSLVFSGSNPHLLSTMFEDDRRPLYKLCKEMRLTRISKAHYASHLNKAAKAMWGGHLAQATFESIMQLTERHPFYVNALCDEVWSESNKLPTEKDVKKAWETVVDGERSDLIKDFLRLSGNQRKLLIYISNQDGNNLFSTAAAKKMDIPVSSLSSAATALLEKDYIEKTSDGFSIVTPALKAILTEAC
jgi:uncharacterized protein